MLRHELPPDVSDRGAVEILAPRLVELCFQTAGMLDLAERSVLGLPARVDELRVRPPAGSDGGARFAEVRRRREDDGFDARVIDAEGNVLVEVTGYHTVALSERKTLQRLRGAAPEGGPA
jgi:hypothetical protein